MRKALPYRSVAVLALLALVVSAFAPASVPCAMDEAQPPAPMPCHAGMADAPPHGESAPHTPEKPAPPRPASTVMTCCNGGAALTAPAARAGADLGAVAAVALEAVALPAPASPPNPVQSTDASPPAPARLHLLFGCFLT